MAKPVIMPRFGMTQEEATIVEWLVKEGEYVEPDDPIAEVTTDKVNMEVPAPAEGYLGGLRYNVGDTVPVTQVIAYILAEGERQRRFRMVVDLRLQDLGEVNGVSNLVGNLEPDVGLARDVLHHADADGGKRARQVLRKTADLAGLGARRQVEFEQGDDGTRVDFHHLCLDAEIRQLHLHQPRHGVEGFFGILARTGLGRIQEREQRQHVRFDIEVSAEVYTGSQVQPAATRNLSNGGVCLEMEGPLEEGSEVGLSLFLTLEGIEAADTDTLNVGAQVVWCSDRDAGGYLAGARFTKLEPSQAELLSTFLAALEGMEQK